MKHEDLRFGMSRVLILHSWKGVCVHFITGNKVSPILAVKYYTLHDEAILSLRILKLVRSLSKLDPRNSSYGS